MILGSLKYQGSLHMLDHKGIYCTVWGEWHLLQLTHIDELARLLKFTGLTAKLWKLMQRQISLTIHFLHAGGNLGQILEELKESWGESSSDSVGYTMQPGASHCTRVAVPLSLSFPITWDFLHVLLVIFLVVLQTDESAVERSKAKQYC